VRLVAVVVLLLPLLLLLHALLANEEVLVDPSVRYEARITPSAGGAFGSAPPNEGE